MSVGLVVTGQPATKSEANSVSDDQQREEQR